PPDARPISDDLTPASHAPADQMTAQPTGGRQGLFQVHPTAALQVGEAGARQGLATDVGPEAVTGQLDGGQTDAVDGDAVAELHVTEIQLRSEERRVGKECRSRWWAEH